MHSLRRRLMFGTMLGSILVFSAAGLGLYGLIRASLRAEFDRGLAVKAGFLASLVEVDEGRIEMEIENAVLPEFSRPRQPEYFELWAASGQVAVRSPSLNSCDLARPDHPPTEPTFNSVVLPDGRPGRSVVMSFRPRSGSEDERPAGTEAASLPPLTLAVAVETAPVDDTLSRIRLILVGVCLTAALLAAAVLAGVVHMALRPVSNLAERIAGLDAADLATRLPVAEAPIELQPVIARLNDLLARLQGTFMREKSFTADVAHELRTPLAGLRSTLEVNLARVREADVYRNALADCLIIVRQLQNLVENLLTLARLESAGASTAREPVMLHDLLAKCWELCQEQAEERSLRVLLPVAEPVVVESDPQKLRHVLLNVLENAATYADPGGEIRVEVENQGGGACIRVINTGCHLAPGDEQRVFERFWRGDAARHDAGVHCGLGLPLCKRMVEALGGSIQATCPPEGTFVITIWIPSKPT